MKVYSEDFVIVRRLGPVCVWDERTGSVELEDVVAEALLDCRFGFKMTLISYAPDKMVSSFNVFVPSSMENICRFVVLS